MLDNTEVCSTSMAFLVAFHSCLVRFTPTVRLVWGDENTPNQTWVYYTTRKRTLVCQYSFESNLSHIKILFFSPAFLLFTDSPFVSSESKYKVILCVGDAKKIPITVLRITNPNRVPSRV